MDRICKYLIIYKWYMNQYCIVSKTSEEIIAIIFENVLPNYAESDFYRIILTHEQLNRICSVDVLSFRMNVDIPEVYIDPMKYNTCSGMNDIRDKRNTLLKLTDWMVLPDSPLSTEIKSDILEYRRSLRNLPNGNIHPYDIEIPRHHLVSFPWEYGVTFSQNP